MVFEINVVRRGRVNGAVRLAALNVHSAMEDEGNPYSAPEDTRDPQCARCPICQHSVRRIRFMLPLGHCSGCGNYLKIENDSRNVSLRCLVLLIITLSSRVFDSLGIIALEHFPLFTIWFGFLGLCDVYDKVVGRLVPAVWWGFFPLRDDTGLKTRSEKQSKSG